MGDMLQFLVLGLGTGALYALGAHGIVLIYRGSGVINFSHGAMALFGAALFAELRDDWQWSVTLALPAALLATAVIGLLVDQLVMRRLREASPLGRLVVTLGVLAIIESVVIVRYGSGLRFVDSFLPNHSVSLPGAISIGADRLWILSIALLLTVLLWALYRFAEFGRQTTAVAENVRSASAMGISANRVSAINWMLGSAMAALAGILLAPVTGLMPATMVLLINPLLAAALVGGFASFPLTLLGGLIIGVAQGWIGYMDSGTGWSASVPFLLIVVTMMLRGKALPLRGFIGDRLPLVGEAIRPGWMALAGLIVAVTSILLASEDIVNGITGTLLAATVLLSIVTVTGLAGQVSLAQYALAGIGAFVAARLAAVYGWSFPLVFVLALLVTIPAGLLFAIPALRTRGANLAIVTLGLGLALDNLLFKNIDYTGGFAGTQVQPVSLFGISFDGILYPERFALLALLLFCLCALLLGNVRRGISGRRLLATRSNERAASALGINVVGAKLYAFALGAGFAAAGGALGAFRYPNVRFDAGFSPFESIPAMLMAFLGGIGFIGGALIGGLLSVGGLVNELLSSLLDLKEWQGLVIGLGAIFVVIAHPNGLAEVFSRLLKWLSNRLPIANREATATGPSHSAIDNAEAISHSAKTLQVENLSVQFGGLVALDKVSFTLPPGQVVGLIGPNGAGKTTMIDTITGFTAASSGSIFLDGARCNNDTAMVRARAGLGRTFQSLELFDDLTVADNLRVACDPRQRRFYLADLFGSKALPFPPSVMHTIETFGLTTSLDCYPQQLSFGQRRLLGIARAVAANPAVLLLDEPAAGLDSNESRELGEIIRWLAAQKNMAILLVEHDMGLVMSICDRLVVLDFGHKLAEGSPTEISQNPAVIKAYLGGHGNE
jgi:sulfate-transporting ATPase